MPTANRAVPAAKATRPFSRNANGVQKRDAVQLEKRITLFGGCSIIVGIIVGSGIFISPRGILEHTGSAALSLILWLTCGLYTALGALCYAELGTSIPKNGGDYVYIKEAYGDLAAFIYLWVSLLIVAPVPISIVALTFAQNVLKPFFAGDDCVVPNMSLRLLAACSILLLTFVNCYSVRWSTRISEWTSVGKIGAMLSIVVAAIFYTIFGTAKNLSWTRLTAGGRYDLASLGLAFYSGSFSYGGWNYLNFLTEEIREPHRNLPWAICISISLATTIYCFVNLAYFVVLSPSELLASSAVAVSFAERVLGPVAPLMPLLVAMSCFGTLNGEVLAPSRMFFAGARDGLMPELLAMINATWKTPTLALLLEALVAVAMLAVFDTGMLINYWGFVQTLVYCASVVALLKLRWQRPKMDRPIKVNLIVPIVYLALTAYIVMVPLFTQTPTELIAASVVTLSALPVYWLFIRESGRSNAKTGCFASGVYHFWVSLTHQIQKLLIVVADGDNAVSDEHMNERHLLVAVNHDGANTANNKINNNDSKRMIMSG